MQPTLGSGRERHVRTNDGIADVRTWLSGHEFPCPWACMVDAVASMVPGLCHRVPDT